MTVDIASLVSDNLDIWTTAVARKSGAGRGSGKKLNLYGIERLRTFILDLAVSGKLVPQDPGDEPASGMLKRIKAASSTSSKRTQRHVIQTSEMPTGWSVLSFGELAKDISTGPFGTMIHKEDYILGGTPLINPSHMVEDRIVEDLSVSLSSTKAEELGSYSLEPGDIVFARRGEVGRLAIVTEREAGWLCGTGSFRARFVGNEVQPYLLKFFRSQKVRSFLGSESVGATMANLNQGILSELPISLPPLAEQQRIVAKVDELMALCDALEAQSAAAMAAQQTLVEALLATLTASTDVADLAANWSRLEAHFHTLFTTEASVDALKQTVLKLAARGKLVRQDPTDEPVSVLIKRAQAERQNLVQSRKIRGAELPATPSPAEQKYSIPESWKFCALGQISLITDPNPSHRYPDYTGGTVPILSTQEFCGEFDWDPTTAKLTTDLVWQSQADACDFSEGDIIFARKGRLGLPRFLPKMEKYTFSHTLFVIKPMSGVYPNFLLWLLRRNEVIGWLTNEMNQNTGVPTLGKAKTDKLPLPIPPYAEQLRIVAKVDELMTLCDALKARITDAAVIQNHLADAITDRAAA